MNECCNEHKCRLLLCSSRPAVWRPGAFPWGRLEVVSLVHSMFHIEAGLLQPRRLSPLNTRSPRVLLARARGYNLLESVWFPNEAHQIFDTTVKYLKSFGCKYGFPQISHLGDVYRLHSQSGQPFHLHPDSDYNMGYLRCSLCITVCRNLVQCGLDTVLWRLHIRNNKMHTFFIFLIILVSVCVKSPFTDGSSSPISR